MDIFSKATINFTYVLSSTYFPRSNTENIPNAVALHLRRICDFDSKFEKRSAEYQKYLITISYKPSKVKKQFSDVRNILTEETRRPKLVIFQLLVILLDILNLCFLTLKLFFKIIYMYYTATKNCYEFFQKIL